MQKQYRSYLNRRVLIYYQLPPLFCHPGFLTYPYWNQRPAEHDYEILDAKSCSRVTPVLHRPEFLKEPDCVSVMIKHQLQTPGTVDCLGRTALHIALGHRVPLESLSLLLKWGVPVNHQDLFGQYLLHILCGSKPVEAPRWPSEAPNWEAKAMAKLLDPYNVNADLRDREGRSPLLMAAKNGCEELVELLLAHNGVVTADSIDQNQRTPLYWAVIGGHTTIVKLLLATREVDINHVDWSYCTPLSTAAGGGHEKIVRLLLTNNGIRVNWKDLLGRTPLSLASGGSQVAA